jgi:hypothetical protein
MREQLYPISSDGGIHEHVIDTIRHRQKTVTSPWLKSRESVHLPYDVCVQTALIVLSHHLGSAIRIGSDGKDDDWAEARRICQEHLGYGEEFRLTSSA